MLMALIDIGNGQQALKHVCMKGEPHIWSQNLKKPLKPPI